MNNSDAGEEVSGSRIKPSTELTEFTMNDGTASKKTTTGCLQEILHGVHWDHGVRKGIP
jgi:hypothetical protein